MRSQRGAQKNQSPFSRGSRPGGRPGAEPLDDLYLLGPNVIEEVAKYRPEWLDKVWIESGRAELADTLDGLNIPMEVVTKEFLERKTDRMNHQGVAAYMRAFPYDDISAIATSDKEDWLAFDEITDPQNAGAMIRSAAAFGFSGIIIPSDRSIGVTSTVVRVSMGTIVHLKIVRITNLSRTLATLRDEHDFSVFGLSGDSSVSVSDAAWRDRNVVVIGSEGKGLRRLTKEHCDQMLSIPIRAEVESLNASAAASIALWARSIARN